MGTARADVNNIWKEKWEEGKSVWHKSNPNPLLVEFFNRFDADSLKNKRILVPMCGKSVDMKWLYDQGMSVVGVDVVELAVKQFFCDNNMEYEVKDSSIPGATLFHHDERMSILLCDIFNINTEVIGGPCSYIWDRGALGAIQYTEVEKYTKIVESVLADDAQGLIECFTFDRGLIPGPPYAVTKEEVFEYYSCNFFVEQLCKRKESELPSWYATANEKLLDSAMRTVYYIKRK